MGRKLLACFAREGRSSAWSAPFVLLAAFLAVAALRWPGPLPPYGSDTDEHLLVARTLVETGDFDVAGLHATKYPPGVSALAAFVIWSGGDPARWLVLFNALCLFLAALVTWRLADEASGPLCGLAAGLFVIVNPTAWSSVHKVKGDIPFLLVVTLTLWLALSLSRERWNVVRFSGAVVVAAVAVLTRSVGIVAGWALLVGVLLAPGRARSVGRLALASLVLLVPLALVSIGLFVKGDSPQHPTGYVETFRLRDPYDASLGALGPSDVPARLVRGSISYVADVSTALTEPSFERFVAVLIAAALLLAPFGALGRRCLVLASFFVPYSALIVIWPYRSTRFAIPLLALAALGLAVLLARGAALGRRARALLVALLVCHLANVAGVLARDGREEASARRVVHGALDDLEAWAAPRIEKGARLASFDYRMLTWRLRRPVVPLGYTSDVRVHLRSLCESEADLLVVSHSIFPLRGDYGSLVVRELGSPSPSYAAETFRVYPVESACEAGERLDQEGGGAGGR